MKLIKIIEKALMINPTFKKGHLYETKETKLIVLCTKNHWKDESRWSWEGVVIFTSPIEGVGDRNFQPGFKSDGWNGEEDHWNDLGPGK